MNTSGLPETPLRNVIRHELQAIRGKWIWLVVLGIALIVLGIMLLGFPVISRRGVLVSGVERVFPRLALGHSGRRGRSDAARQPHSGRNHLDHSAGEFSLRGRYFQGRSVRHAPVWRLGLAPLERRDRHRARRHDLA